MTAHSTRPYLVTAAVLVAAILLSIAIGSVSIPPAALFGLVFANLTGATVPAEWAPYQTILFSLRLPRTALVMLAGAGLGSSGAAYQGLFRNPLADPYLIGVAAGAGLGAVAVMSMNWPYTPLGLMAVPLGAFAGALLTVATVYVAARVGHAVPATNLLLAGVAVSSFATSLTSFLLIRASGEVHRALAWLLGGASFGGWQPVLASLPYIAGGLGVLFFMGHALNVMQFGDEQAQQLGLPIARIRKVIVTAATLTTAVAISFSGIIGFVGLIVPHLVRLVWGPDYRRLMPLAALAGAAFLLAADILARVVLAPQEVPVGIITALAGAPFFLWVLRRAKRQYFW